jgi:flagellar hook assembly protein FlgD
VAARSPVRIDVFDADGSVVATLADRVYEAGRWTVEWDGAAADGRRVASGVYFYRLRVGTEMFVRKLVLLK